VSDEHTEPQDQQDAREGGSEAPPAPRVPADTPPAPQVPADIPPAPQVPADTPPAPQIPAETPPAPQIPAETPPAPQVPAETPPAPQVPGPRPGPPKPGPPRPGPPPGARPGPPPGARPPTAPAHPAGPAPTLPVIPAQVSPVPTASDDPARWGRVDEEGAVFLRTPDGERQVGSWQAGEPAEGLAHFARRFDDLLAETELVVTRLGTGAGDPKHALTSAKGLREGLDDAAVVGDVEALAARLDELIGQAEEAVGAARSARDAQRQAAVARKEDLATEAEGLAEESSQWKQAGDRFKEILDEWRTIKGIDRKTDEALWKRFSRAREAFNRRRGSHFADLDRQRSSARTRKEELVAEAESLAGSDDWGPTAARYRDLMTEWKEAGRAHKDADDTLWHRFRAAQDAFFQHRSAVFAERDSEFEANAEAKRRLLDEAEKINTADAEAARAALRSIQERWEEIGKVPRDDMRPLEQRLRAVEETVRQAADREWRRTDPEAEARVAQFRERVAQFEAQADKARASGDAKRARQAEGQAEQWREWLKTAEQSVQER